jgi:mannose-6-phosphate isomerase-like protein (cupin superfamily)
VVAPGTVVSSPRGTRIEVKESSPERLVLERQLPPGTGKTPEHVHQDGIERFELLGGEATGSVDGRSRLLSAGDVLEVPVGAKHVHPHTSESQTATVIHTIEPRVRFVDVFFASYFEWLREGKTDRQDEPHLLGVMAVMRVGGGGTWVAGPPVPLQKGLAQVLGLVAAMRGYRPTT